MAEEKGLEFLAVRNDERKCGAFDVETIVECNALQLKAVGGQKFYMTVIDETDPIKVYHSQIWCVCTNFAYINHL